jgi:hypothetical protein
VPKIIDTAVHVIAKMMHQNMVVVSHMIATVTTTPIHQHCPMTAYLDRIEQTTQKFNVFFTIPDWKMQSPELDAATHLIIAAPHANLAQRPHSRALAPIRQSGTITTARHWACRTSAVSMKRGIGFTLWTGTFAKTSEMDRTMLSSGSRGRGTCMVRGTNNNDNNTSTTSTKMIAATKRFSKRNFYALSQAT